MTKSLLVSLLLIASLTSAATVGLDEGSQLEIKFSAPITLQKDTNYDQTMRSRSYVFDFAVFLPVIDPEGFRMMRVEKSNKLTYYIPVIPLLRTQPNPDSIRCRLQGFTNEERIIVPHEKIWQARVVYSKNRGAQKETGSQARDLQMILKQDQTSLLLSCMIIDTNADSSDVRDIFGKTEFLRYLQSLKEFEDVRVILP